MGMDNFVNKRPRFAFSREFPAGCGISSSSSSLVSCSRVKYVYNFNRDLPPGCGPNAGKITQTFPEKLESVRISGSVGGVRTKPPLNDKTLLIIPVKPRGKEAAGFCSMDAVKIKPLLSEKLVKEGSQKVKGREAGGFCSMGIMRNKNSLSDEMVAQNRQNLKGNDSVDAVKNRPPLSDKLVKGEELVRSGERENVLEMLRLFR